MDVPSGLPDRLYSTFLVKSFDEDQRIIEGLASTPALDRQGDIMESAGAEFALPHPLLWQHKHDEPIGHVVSAKVTPAGIYIRAQLAKAGVWPHIDKAWALIKAGLVGGLSVGWSPKDIAPAKGGRFHVKKWKWMETSAVTIAANQHATISLIKSLDAARPAAPGTGPRIPRTPPGASGISRNSIMNISEQLGEVQTDLQTKSARLEELVAQEGSDGGLSTEEATELESLTDGVKSLTKQMGRLQALEAAQAMQARVIAHPASVALPAQRMPRIEVKELPKGTLFTRYAMAIAAGKGSLSDTIAYAKRWDGQTPQVSRYIKAEAGSTLGGSPGWGSELVPDRTLPGEFVELVRAATVLDKLNGLRRVPARTTIQVQTGGSTFEWVGEGAEKPVGELAFSTVPIGDHKVAGIVVLTEELVRSSSPSAEETVRRDLVAQCARFLDQQFLTPGITASASNPESITNGVDSPAATGADADALYADMNAALATFDNADMGTANVYVITTPALARGISTLRNALGQFEFNGVSMTGGTLMGLPVIVSSTVPSGMIILVKADEIFLADEGRVRLDASNQATLNMSPGSPGAATFSLWQRNCIGIRAEQFITWAKRRADSVAIIDTAAYGPSVGSP